jgi:hypothetical protein
MREAVSPSQRLSITLSCLATETLVKACNVLLDTFTARQTEGNRMDIVQFCPQIIQCFRARTTKIKLNLINTVYCATRQH